MLQLRLEGKRGLFRAAPTSIRLGELAEIVCERRDAGVELRARVAHERLQYLTPLADWSATDRLSFWPEAPGAYQVVADWRDARGGRGQATLEFSVESGGVVSLAPAAITLADGGRLWTPSAWEAATFAQYEPTVLSRLPELLHAGDVAWDVGANIGVYSLALARLVGAHGCVYAFEPNPLCLYFLRANLHENALRNTTIVPLALSDSETPLDFSVNFGNCHLGLGATSVFHGSKVGHHFSAAAAPGDGLAAGLGLRAPQLLKIDVEGGEAAVLRGLQETIAAHRPALVMEVHGHLACKASMQALEPHGYHFEVLETGERFANAGALAAAYPDVTRQVLGLPA